MTAKNKLVNPKKYNSKRYHNARDFFSSDKNTKALIELKLTGSLLVFHPNGIPQFVNEINRYNVQMVNQGTKLFLLMTYFEDNPEIINDIVQQHGSVLRFFTNDRAVTVSDSFKINCLEAYAFRGAINNWQFIDNKVVFGL